MLNWSHHFESFTVVTLTWLTITEYLCTNVHGYIPFVVITCRSIPHSWLITVFMTRVIRWVPHVDHELLTFHSIIYLSWWCSCCWCCQITHVHVLRSMLWCPLRIPSKNDVRFILKTHVLYILFVFIYVYWCPTRL